MSKASGAGEGGAGVERFCSPPACGRGRGRACATTGDRHATNAPASEHSAPTRRVPNSALWQHLQLRAQIAGVRFNRQMPIGPYHLRLRIARSRSWSSSSMAASTPMRPTTIAARIALLEAAGLSRDRGSGTTMCWRIVRRRRGRRSSARSRSSALPRPLPQAGRGDVLGRRRSRSRGARMQRMSLSPAIPRRTPRPHLAVGAHRQDRQAAPRPGASSRAAARSTTRRRPASTSTTTRASTTASAARRMAMRSAG